MLLWHGHYAVTVVGRDVMLPLHSLTAFIWGVVVTYNFNLFPSFLAFSIGWIMLACNAQVREAPSPWHQARAYWPLVTNILLGRSIVDTISVNQGAAAMAVYNERLQERAERLQREKEMGAEYDRKLKEELGIDLDGAGGDDDDVMVSNRQKFMDNITFNPIWLQFKPTLYPIQKELRRRVLQLRIATSIVTWQETIYAFWVTTISFIVAMACFWVPWGLILQWSLRLAVWIILGPWMAIIARYHFPEMMAAHKTDEEWNEDVKNRLEDRYREAVAASTHIQKRKESTLKRKALSRWMFGQYHLRVPRFSEDLCPDIPLPSSFSEPFNPETALPIQIKERVFGQNLYGDMIPQREVQVATAGKREAKANIFIKAGLERYFDEAYGWAQFLNVSKVAYVVGCGGGNGRVYVKKNGKDATLVGTSTLMIACAGWSVGATIASEIIFFEDKDAFKRFSSGQFEFEAGTKVSVISISADCTAGTTSGMKGIRYQNATDVSGTRYHDGLATFIIGKVGMMLEVFSVAGQKFTYQGL